MALLYNKLENLFLLSVFPLGSSCLSSQIFSSSLKTEKLLAIFVNDERDGDDRDDLEVVCDQALVEALESGLFDDFSERIDHAGVLLLVPRVSLHLHSSSYHVQRVRRGLRHSSRHRAQPEANRNVGFFFIPHMMVRCALQPLVKGEVHRNVRSNALYGGEFFLKKKIINNIKN